MGAGLLCSGGRQGAERDATAGGSARGGVTGSDHILASERHAGVRAARHYFESFDTNNLLDFRTSPAVPPGATAWAPTGALVPNPARLFGVSGAAAYRKTATAISKAA